MSMLQLMDSGVAWNPVPFRWGHAHSGELHGIWTIEQWSGSRGWWWASPWVLLPEQLGGRLSKVADLILYCLHDVSEVIPSAIISAENESECIYALRTSYEPE